MKAFITIVLVSISTIASADWQLLGQESELSFIATKNARVADNHYFTDLSGSVDDDGNAELTVRTASVQSNIDKRDARLRSILFRVAEYPEANVSLRVRKSYVQPQPPGSSRQLDVSANVSMLGVDFLQQARLNVVHLANGNVEVSTIEPILLGIESYGMGPAIDELRKLAGLKSISTKVPISFRLVFQPEES